MCKEDKMRIDKEIRSWYKMMSNSGEQNRLILSEMKEKLMKTTRRKEK